MKCLSPAAQSCARGVCRSDCVNSGFDCEVVRFRVCGGEEIGAILPGPTAQIPPVPTAAAAPFLEWQSPGLPTVVKLGLAFPHPEGLSGVVHRTNGVRVG